MKMKHVANRRRSVSSRAFIALLALVLVIGCVAGGTVAWLVATTDTVTNTFTYGKIDITLTETERTYNIVPGVALDKDPKVTVKGGSEDCWLFVKVGQPIAFATGVSYEIAEGWTMLENGVYYREVSKADTDSEYYVLKNNKVTVSSDLTKGRHCQGRQQPHPDLHGLRRAEGEHRRRQDCMGKGHPLSNSDP